MNNHHIISLLIGSLSTREKARLSVVQKSWNEFNKETFYINKMTFVTHRIQDYIPWLKSRGHLKCLTHITFICNFLQSEERELENVVQFLVQNGLYTNSVKSLSIHQCNGLDAVNMEIMGNWFPNIEEVKICHGRQINNVVKWVAKSKIKSIKVVGSVSSSTREQFKLNDWKNCDGEAISFETDYHSLQSLLSSKQFLIDDKWTLQ